MYYEPKSRDVQNSSQSVDRDHAQRSKGHLQGGAVGEVAATLLGQRPILLGCQPTRSRKELVEHSRTSKRKEKGEWFDYGSRSYVAFNLAEMTCLPAILQAS
jgi:hypothetical protein